MNLKWTKKKRPDFNAVTKIRQEKFLNIHKDVKLMAGSNVYYKTRPVQWINDWGITYDPRNIGTKFPTTMPFILFPRQAEFVKFLYECMLDQENGATEKCRDVGATWVAVNFTYWLFKYHEGSSIGWGSRKEQLVDRIGDIDSIFEKIRKLIENLPSFCKPVGYEPRVHGGYMKIINPENGSSITGEAGDNIGRGGRKTMFFKDESSHYIHPESIQAALDDNTNCQIDISSVNGPDTVFQRKINTGINWSLGGKKIKSGETRIFIFDWRDHPLKTQAWYNKRREKAEREGLLHKFAQEVDRDPVASKDMVVIPPIWVDAALDAHKKLGIEISGQKIAGFDVADEGIDNHGLAIRHGILTTSCKEWHSGDVGQATQEALRLCKIDDVNIFNYDSIGVGAGVKSDTNRMIREGIISPTIVIVPWIASASPIDPYEPAIDDEDEGQSIRNIDYYANLKAQGWWKIRKKFETTYRAINEPGFQYDPDDLISISSKIKDFQLIRKQLSQATYSVNQSGKILINKKPNGTKSPNIADGMIMAYLLVGGNEKGIMGIVTIPNNYSKIKNKHFSLL